MKKINDLYYNVKHGVRNLWYWKKVIWEDRWYDYIFLLDMMRHKLKHTERMTREFGCHINHVRDADKMKIAINLLDRIMEDDYYERAVKTLHEQYGEPEMHWSDVEEDANLTKLDITHENIKTEEDQTDYNKRFREASLRQAKQKQGDINYLFKFMAKHLQSWWD